MRLSEARPELERLLIVATGDPIEIGPLVSVEAVVPRFEKRKISHNERNYFTGSLIARPYGP